MNGANHHLQQNHNHHQQRQQQQSQSQQYWNLVSVQARREDGSSCRVAGAVLGNQPHIVQVRRLFCVVYRSIYMLVIGVI